MGIMITISAGDAVMILGLGVDICDVSRLRRAMARTGFRRRVFGEAEARYCARRARPEQHFAARFAAKEAFFKALGFGWSGGLGWRDVAVSNRRSGEPELRVKGAAARLSRKRGVVRSHLSLSHSGDYAVAVVLLEGDGPDGGTSRNRR
jgi:holo-[acyl-carrier protein] synthase